MKWWWWLYYNMHFELLMKAQWIKVMQVIKFMNGTQTVREECMQKNPVLYRIHDFCNTPYLFCALIRPTRWADKDIGSSGRDVTSFCDILLENMFHAFLSTVPYSVSCLNWISIFEKYIFRPIKCYISSNKVVLPWASQVLDFPIKKVFFFFQQIHASNKIFLPLCFTGLLSAKDSYHSSLLCCHVEEVHQQTPVVVIIHAVCWCVCGSATAC